LPGRTTEGPHSRRPRGAPAREKRFPEVNAGTPLIARNGNPFVGSLGWICMRGIRGVPR